MGEATLEVWVKGEYIFADSRGNRIARHRPQSAVQVELAINPVDGQKALQCSVQGMSADVQRLTYSESVDLDEELVHLTIVRHGVLVNEMDKGEATHWTSMPTVDHKLAANKSDTAPPQINAVSHHDP